jgi:heptosyltransferase-1
VVARFAVAPVDGFDAASAREGIATIAYARHVAVPKALHAVDRLRRLLAAALGYPVPDGPADFGVVRSGPGTGPFLFLHGTTWDNKRWPETFWRALAATVTAHGHEAVLPWGGDDERARAARIASNDGRVRVAPRLPLCDIVGAIAGARAVVTVDSGLGQLAAALGVPTVALFGPTDPALTGCRGARAVNLAAAFPCAPCRRRRCDYRGAPVVRDGAVVEPPCFSSLPPERVWAALESVL